jgi:hypothetical protein
MGMPCRPQLLLRALLTVAPSAVSARSSADRIGFSDDKTAVVK